MIATADSVVVVSVSVVVVSVFSTKFAVNSVFSDIVIVMFVSVNPLDQLENTFPSSGIADRVT